MAASGKALVGVVATGVALIFVLAIIVGLI